MKGDLGAGGMVRHGSAWALPPFGDSSVVVDPTVDIGGIEITEHLQWGRGFCCIGMPLLIRLQFLDALYKLAGNGLIPFLLGIGKFQAVALELFLNCGHGLERDGFWNGPQNLTLNLLDPVGSALRSVLILGMVDGFARTT